MTARHTGAAVVAACRKLMQGGRMGLTMRACCARAGWSVRTGQRASGRAMLDGHSAAAKPKSFVREPQPARPRSPFWRIGNIAKAHYERLLAAVETREPDAWAADQGNAP